MITREMLWQRCAGSHAWSVGWTLCWAIGLACTLPWWVPEEWNGHFSSWQVCLVLAGISMGLVALGLKRVRWLGQLLLVFLVTLLGMRHAVLRDKALPEGLIAFEGRMAAPWLVVGERRVSQLVLHQPEVCRGAVLRLSLPLEGEPAPAPGSWVRFRSEWQSVESAPAFLGERPLWRARAEGIPKRIHLRSALMMEEVGEAQPSLLLRLRCFVLGRFQGLPLSGSGRDLWGALTLGLPPAQEDVFSAFAESGTIHTLVVSGLQVTLVMVCLEALWRRLLKRGATVGAVLGGLLYGALVGYSAPVWRGLLMGIAWALGKRTGWKLPPVMSLHGALLLWLLWHPAAGADPGFLLAWYALLSLLWGVEPLASLWQPLVGKSSLWLARFVVPWLATLPLLALFHGGAPRLGVVANMLVLPLVSVLTPLCLGLTLLPLPWLVVPLGALLTWLGDDGMARFASIQPLATGFLLPWFVLLVGWPLLAHWHARFRPTRALTVGLVALSLFLFFVRGTGRTPRTLEWEAPDVGQGDALLLRQPKGEAVLVDTGPSPWAARRLVRVLSRRGVRESVHLIITHPHGDHATGWATLSRLWPLVSFRLPVLPDPDDQWAGYAPQKKRFFPETLRRGDQWRMGECVWRVHWPPNPLSVRDANMVSLVMSVRWQDREVWLMGDVLAIQEQDLMDLGEPGAAEGVRRVMKAGHHGSTNASSEAWLAQLRPEHVLFTAGRYNRFGFPHEATLARYRALGISGLHVTGPAKGVRFNATPGGWQVVYGSGVKIPSQTAP